MLLLAAATALLIQPETGHTFRQPQLASSGDRVVLAFGDGDSVMAAVSDDRGATFGKPMRLPTAGKLALGRHRGPRVALSGKGIVVTAIAGQKGGGQDGDVLAWRSTDGGATWSTPVRVNDVAGSAREGLHGMASGNNGLLYAAWLDLRSGGTKLYGAFSKDGGATWSTNRLIYSSPDGNICECCHPSVAIDAKGRIHVMFRNWLDGARDMWLASSTGNGLSFQAAKLGDGTWKLNACPMDGGGLATGKRGLIWAWRREQTIFAPGAIGRGKDPTVAANKNGLPIVAWIADGEVMLNGQPLGKGAGVALSGGDRPLVAWETPAGISVQQVP